MYIELKYTLFLFDIDQRFSPGVDLSITDFTGFFRLIFVIFGGACVGGGTQHALHKMYI
jgi:hypothetical protein